MHHNLQDRLAISKQWVKLIQGARVSLKVCAYSLTNTNIVSQLRAASERGVAVEVLLDNEQSRRDHADVCNKMLKDSKRIKVHYRGDTHCKFLIADDLIGWFGSANMTNMSEAKQLNLGFTTDDVEHVKVLVDLWGKLVPQLSS